MAGFDWAQFRALFGAIRKGEERADNGMGKSGGTGGTSRIVSLVFSFGMIAAMLLVEGRQHGGTHLAQLEAADKQHGRDHAKREHQAQDRKSVV